MGVAGALPDTAIADAGLHGADIPTTGASRTGRAFFGQAGFAVLREGEAIRNGVALRCRMMARPLGCMRRAALMQPPRPRFSRCAAAAGLRRWRHS